MEKLMYSTEMKTYHYLIEPGDHTQYRFFYGYVPLGAQNLRGRRNAVIADSMLIASGISESPEKWILVGINMVSGDGLGVVNLDELKKWPAKSNVYHSMTSPGHGFTHCDRYVVCAVLFALKALIGGAPIMVAAQEMRKAGEEVGKYV